MKQRVNSYEVAQRTPLLCPEDPHSREMGGGCPAGVEQELMGIPLGSSPEKILFCAALLPREGAPDQQW